MRPNPPDDVDAMLRLARTTVANQRRILPLLLKGIGT